MARQISFKEGEIDLLKQRVVITPNDFFVVLGIKLDKDKELALEMYTGSKEAVTHGFAKELNKHFNFKTGGEFITWLINIAGLSGWGESKLVRLNDSSSEGVLQTKNCPVGTSLKGKVKYPVEHIWRGLLAGGASAVYNKPIDVVETKCVALGDRYCEFVFKPTAKFKEESNNRTKRQIGI